MELHLPEFFLLFFFGDDGGDFLKTNFDEQDLVQLAPATASNTDILESVILQKLRLRQRAVFDASQLSQSCRIRIKKLAKKYHAPSVCLVQKWQEESHDNFNRRLKELKNDGFRDVQSIESKDALSIILSPNPNDKSDLTGPFDIVGDVHGCFEEFCLLLDKLGYDINYKELEKDSFYAVHPEERKLIFVGDLVDKGPNTPSSIHLCMELVRVGMAHCVLGNHEAKLLKKLKGRNVTLNHGLDKSIAQFEKVTPDLKAKIVDFMEQLPHHLVFDNGNLVVAHAGIQEAMILRDSGGIKAFCLYGETTGKLDVDGLPERKNWARNYSGEPTVVHGHVPVKDLQWQNNVLDIDTGCVYGGSLTALRYPEMELISIPAKEVYSTPKNGRNPFKGSH